MAITKTWSVSNMVRNEGDGGVTTVYWSMVASDGTYSATEGGKLRLEPDSSAEGFVAYADLTEATVLGWVQDSLREGDETKAQAKARIEAERVAKVQGQIDRAAATADGVPWTS